MELKKTPLVRHVRGEEGGMVWGLEAAEFAGRPAAEVANALVLAAYRGDGRGRGVHLLGPLSQKVIRVAPPLVLTEAEARDALEALSACVRETERRLAGRTP